MAFNKTTTIAPLGSVAKVISGYAFKSSDFEEKGVPVIKIKNIRTGAVDLSDSDFVNDRFLQLPPRYHVQKGDVLISLTGSHLSQPNSVVGRVARHGKNLPNCLLNQRGGKIQITDESLCDPTYLFYVLSQPDVGRKIALKAHGAANQANVSPTQVESIDIPLPPLSEQKRIAGILSAYDDLIENNQRRIRILEEMARSLYREWFVHFRYPGHEKVPLVDSEMGKIPKRWKVSTLGEIGEEVRRNVQPGELTGETVYVGLEHIPRRKLCLDAWAMARDLGSNKLEFKRNEVLFGKIRPYFHKVSIAPFDGICSADTMVFRPVSIQHYGWFVSTLFSDEFVAQANASSNGSKMPRANWNVLRQLRYVIPRSDLSQRFSDCFSTLVGLQQGLVFKSKNLEATRSLILEKLFAGKKWIS